MKLSFSSLLGLYRQCVCADAWKATQANAASEEKAHAHAHTLHTRPIKAAAMSAASLSPPPSFPQGVFPTMITHFTRNRLPPNPRHLSINRTLIPSTADGSVDVPVLQALTEW